MLSPPSPIASMFSNVARASAIHCRATYGVVAVVAAAAAVVVVVVSQCNGGGHMRHATWWRSDCPDITDPATVGGWR